MSLNSPALRYDVSFSYNMGSPKAFPRVDVYFKNSNSVDVFLNAKFEISSASDSIVVDTITFTQKVSARKEVSKSIDLYLYYDIQFVQVKVTCYFYLNQEVSLTNVAAICESVKSVRYAPLTVISTQQSPIILKAFCSLPGTEFTTTYVCWEYSTDGVSWDEYVLHTDNGENHFKNISSEVTHIEVNVEDVKTSISDPSLDPPASDSDSTYVTRTMYKLDVKNSLDSFYDRADIVLIPHSGKVGSTLYRMRMCTVKKEPDNSYTEDVLLGMKVFTPVLDIESEFLYNEINSVSKTRGVYYGSVLYFVDNPSFLNNIVASFPGENVVPLSRLVPLNALESSYVTCITPWKNYLIACTTSSVHLLEPVDDGYVSKTINAHIGVPSFDAKCIIPSLNGLIFKSNSKIYLLYPNIYAGEDSVLNITEISKPVANLLENFSNENFSPFAIGTDSTYYLMLPHDKGTCCLVYNYNTRIWTVYTYKVIFTSYEMLSLTDVRLFGHAFNADGTLSDVYSEYIFNISLNDLYKQLPSTLVKQFPYADYLTSSHVDENGDVVGAAPIYFEIDSGQKTDSMNFDKQFVESKFNVVTLHENDTFPMNVITQIDGNPFVTKMDINTDSAFWKTSLLHKGVLSTDFASEHTDLFNVFRQMYLRHSGKGRSVRYIVEGESIYPFKLYEINYRYRNLNTKH